MTQFCHNGLNEIQEKDVSMVDLGHKGLPCGLFHIQGRGHPAKTRQLCVSGRFVTHGYIFF